MSKGCFQPESTSVYVCVSGGGRFSPVDSGNVRRRHGPTAARRGQLRCGVAAQSRRWKLLEERDRKRERENGRDTVGHHRLHTRTRFYTRRLILYSARKRRVYKYTGAHTCARVHVRRRRVNKARGLAIDPTPGSRPPPHPKTPPAHAKSAELGRRRRRRRHTPSMSSLRPPESGSLVREPPPPPVQLLSTL